MTQTTTVPFHAPLLGIRLHTRRLAGGAPQAGRVAQLLDLKVREEQRQAATKALVDLARTGKRTVEAIPQQVGSRLDEVAAIAVELGLAIAREIVNLHAGRITIDEGPGGRGTTVQVWLPARVDSAG